MAAYTIVSPKSASVKITDGLGGTVLATLPMNAVGTTVFVDVAEPWAELYDGSGLLQMKGKLVGGPNYFIVTVALATGATVDGLYPPAVRSYAGLQELAGRLTVGGSNMSTLLHIAAGSRPAADVKGTIVTDAGATVLATAYADSGAVVAATPISSTALGMGIRWTL